MSDNIPLDIQLEIIKRLPLKSVIRFRSVSRTWKSLMDSPYFVIHYSSRMQYLLAPCDDPVDDGGSSSSKLSYIQIPNDDAFPQHRVPLIIPSFVSMLHSCRVIGSSHGLLCLFGRASHMKYMAVIWNVSIEKRLLLLCLLSVHAVLLLGHNDAEVFTLSTGAWISPRGKLPRQSVPYGYGQVIDGVIYWLAGGLTSEMGSYNLIISFDLTSEEFKEVNLPDSLAQPWGNHNLSISKVRESLVVLAKDVDADCQVFWMMVDGVPKSFIKLFDVKYIPYYAQALGLRESGEFILEVHLGFRTSLVTYDPCSKHFNDLGIKGSVWLTYVYPYTETLLLFDHPDFIIYDKGQRHISKLRDEKREASKPTRKLMKLGGFAGYIIFVLA
ncbi:putative F-box protein At1g47790 [Bidens hawaiensis]|uniref:putative F-box protein At1g47790 n=1 Tax=Bidens hawaiensis TaxID=980011 RepID=UPI00404A008B